MAEGKETREFDGRMYVMERSLTADFAGSGLEGRYPMGNLVYRETAMNFNPASGYGGKDYGG